MTNSPNHLPTDYLALDDATLVAQCEVDHYRSSGPGGQKRNKTSSAVRLRHAPTGLSVTATENRSQHVNLVYAVRRLREAIAIHVRRRENVEAYQPSTTFREVVAADGSLNVHERDPRYYVAYQELLDVLAACQMAVSKAAERVGLSTGQLAKLLHANPKVWTWVNQKRNAEGLKPLRGS